MELKVKLKIWRWRLRQLWYRLRKRCRDCGTSLVRHQDCFHCALARDAGLCHWLKVADTRDELRDEAGSYRTVRTSNGGEIVPITKQQIIDDMTPMVKDLRERMPESFSCTCEKEELCLAELLKSLLAGTATKLQQEYAAAELAEYWGKQAHAQETLLRVLDMLQATGNEPRRGHA